MSLFPSLVAAIGTGHPHDYQPRHTLRRRGDSALSKCLVWKCLWLDSQQSSNLRRLEQRHHNGDEAELSSSSSAKCAGQAPQPAHSGNPPEGSSLQPPVCLELHDCRGGDHVLHGVGAAALRRHVRVGDTYPRVPLVAHEYVVYYCGTGTGTVLV